MVKQHASLQAHMTQNRIYSVLYIEDDEANRQLIQLILAQKDYLSLTFAENGASGIKMAKEQLPDLILLDISLPDMDGYAILSVLKNDPATMNIPVIAISGDFPAEYPEGTEFTFDKYLAKPVKFEPLYNSIDRLLKQQPT